MDAYIDSFREFTALSTLESNCRYWQVKIDNRDKDRTALTSRYGFYRLIRMPFRLKNASGSFLRAIDDTSPGEMAIGIGIPV